MTQEEKSRDIWSRIDYLARKNIQRGARYSNHDIDNINAQFNLVWNSVYGYFPTNPPDYWS